MAKNRIVMSMWLLAVICLHIFGNNYGTMVILLASVIIPALFVVLAGIGARRIEFCLIMPESCLCGETVSIRISITGGGFFSGYVKCRILCENLFTGEKYEEELSLGAKGRMETEVLINSHNCGMMSFSIAQLSTVDVFGLMNWRVKFAAQSNILVMPKIFNIQLEINPNKRPVADSEEYSMQRSGSDPGETFAIREYMPGDPLKSIHWKLSHKTEKLLVRELGLPVVDKILMLMETSTSAEPDSISRAASVLFSISHELVIREAHHVMGWLDTAAEKYVSREVANYEDLNGAFSELLANTVREYAVTTLDAYAAAPSEYAFSHVIIAGTHKQNVNHIFDQSLVIVLDDAEISLLEI